MPHLCVLSRRLALAALVLSFAGPGLAQGKDPRREPLRQSSLGDSITEAVNAEEFNPLKLGLTRNRWASWANGYTKDWNSLLDRSDVNSHRQRIDAQFGEEGRKTKSPAKIGADSEDLLKQAAKAVKNQADYVPILMGQNDICGDDASEIPTDQEFEANVRAAFDVLEAGLPAGATIYTLAIVDIYRLWQIGEDLEFAGVIECNEVWEALSSKLIPCATMLDPDLEEAERLATRDRIIGFNTILQTVTEEYDAADTHHYWQYTGASFTMDYDEDDVSHYDCFHPSAEGQTQLAEETWEDGPFFEP